jgi:hypothetical protein
MPTRTPESLTNSPRSESEASDSVPSRPWGVYEFRIDRGERGAVGNSPGHAYIMPRPILNAPSSMNDMGMNIQKRKPRRTHDTSEISSQGLTWNLTTADLVCTNNHLDEGVNACGDEFHVFLPPKQSRRQGQEVEPLLCKSCPELSRQAIDFERMKSRLTVNKPQYSN